MIYNILGGLILPKMFDGAHSVYLLIENSNFVMAEEIRCGFSTKRYRTFISTVS